MRAGSTRRSSDLRRAPSMVGVALLALVLGLVLAAPVLADGDPHCAADDEACALLVRACACQALAAGDPDAVGAGDPDAVDEALCEELLAADGGALAVEDVAAQEPEAHPCPEEGLDDGAALPPAPVEAPTGEQPAPVEEPPAEPGAPDAEAPDPVGPEPDPVPEPDDRDLQQPGDGGTGVLDPAPTEPPEEPVDGEEEPTEPVDPTPPPAPEAPAPQPPALPPADHGQPEIPQVPEQPAPTVQTPRQSSGGTVSTRPRTTTPQGSTTTSPRRRAPLPSVASSAPSVRSFGSSSSVPPLVASEQPDDDTSWSTEDDATAFDGSWEGVPLPDVAAPEEDEVRPWEDDWESTDDGLPPLVADAAPPADGMSGTGQLTLFGDGTRDMALGMLLGLAAGGLALGAGVHAYTGPPKLAPSRRPGALAKALARPVTVDEA